MLAREPVAFWSYVQEDDRHESGRLTQLRERLEGEVRVQTGSSFPIFQDRNDLQWGDHWKSRIGDTVLDVTFLIPVVTPSYFKSSACRSEFETFLKREATLGINRLILPIYYIAARDLDDAASDDLVVATLRARQWADWRGLRFDPLDSPGLRKEVAGLAKSIIAARDELNAVLDKESQTETVETKTGPEIPIARTLKSTPPRVPRRTSAKMPVLKSSKVPVVRGPKLDVAAFEKAKGDNSYYAYTTAFDEVLENPTSLTDAKLTLTQLGLLQKMVDGELAGARSWMAAYIKQLSAVAEKPAVMILIDNSGSMRGKKIESVAAWTTITSEVLQSSEIPHEIVGFTTRAWKGGQSRELWLEDGRPSHPGRVSDLRYLIYKSFGASYQDALPNLGIMLGEGILKENIDGEAVLFAHDRLAEHPAKRKVLIVVSDGSPTDDSTQSINSGGQLFLVRHLRTGVEYVKSRPGFELYAIGIGHDVEAFYGAENSVQLSETTGLGYLDFISSSIANSG